MNNLIIIRVNGGLGNQLFQIGNAYNLSLKFDRKLLICNENQTNRGTYWDSIFSCFKDNLIDITEYNRVKNMARLYNWASSRFEYKEIILNKDIGVYCIEGYYQSYKYIDISTFKQKINYDNLLSKMKNRIIEPNDVALHIRRGDYTQNNFHKLLKLNYYKNCIDEINKIININKIYIFSDDMKWCKNEFKGEQYVYIQDNDVNEMIFISKFNYIIIANSTFSWWSAFLSNNSKIYSPKDWFTSNCKLITKDLRPKKWVIIDDNLRDTNNNVNEQQVDLINNIQLEEEVYFSPRDFNIISLGSACCMVQNIHDNIYNNLGPLYRQPDNATNFFDWVIVDFKSIMYVFDHLKKKDDSFLNKVNFTVKNIFTAPDKVPGGWSSKYRKVEHKDNKMIFLHDVNKELKEIPENFFEKYKRRFERLYDKILNNTSLYFMHCFDFQWLDPYFPSTKEVTAFINMCKVINKNCNVELYFFIHPKYNNDNNKHLFAEYEVTNNLTICYLKNKGFNADWKANNLTWDSFIKKKD